MPVSANSWCQSTSFFYSCSGSSHLAQQHQMSNKKFALLDMLACPCCSHPCSTSHGSSKSMTGTHDWICYVMTAPPMQINFARGGRSVIMKLRIPGKCSTTPESSLRQRAATLESISQVLMQRFPCKFRVAFCRLGLSL